MSEKGKIYWGSSVSPESIRVRGYVGTDELYRFLYDKNNFKELIPADKIALAMDESINTIFDLLQKGGAITASGILIASSYDDIPYPTSGISLTVVRATRVRDYIHQDQGFRFRESKYGKLDQWLQRNNISNICYIPLLTTQLQI